MFQPKAAASDAVAAFVLAGGRSRRMGRDKALLDLAGRPLIAHALSILRDAGFSPKIAGVRSDLSSFAPVVPDSEADLGPLSGVCAALESTSARFCVFASIDMPLLPASLAAYLAKHAQIASAAVTLTSINGVANTFPAVLERSVLPTLKLKLATGRRGCLDGFRNAALNLGRAASVIPVELIAQSGHAAHPRGLPAADWLLNVNTPADLERAERHFRAQIA
jgi:molybdenum cofactor guanylyltransferase